MFCVRSLIALLLLALGAVALRVDLRQSIIQDAKIVSKRVVDDSARTAKVIAHKHSTTQETLPEASQSSADDAEEHLPNEKNADAEQDMQVKAKAMQEEIPGWTVHWDEPTGRPFYENIKTKLAYWEHPMQQASFMKAFKDRIMKSFTKASSAAPRLSAETADEANTANVVYWKNKIGESEEETRRYLDRVAQLEVESFHLQLDEYLDLMSNFVRAEKADEKKPEQIDEVRETFKDEVRQTIQVARMLMQDTRRSGFISDDQQRWFDSLKQTLERIEKFETFQRRLGHYLNLLNTFVSQYPDLMNEFGRKAKTHEDWPEHKVKLALAVEKIRASKMIEEASILMEDATKNGAISWAMQRRFDGLGQQLETILGTVFSEPGSAAVRHA